MMSQREKLTIASSELREVLVNAFDFGLPGVFSLEWLDDQISKAEGTRPCK